MQVLIILKAIGDALGAINNIYQFVKNVQEFVGNPTDENRQRYLATLAVIMQVRDTILQASAEILSAIQALDERLFRQAVSERLGDADTALQDLDACKRTGNDGLLALALDRSASAVATMLQYVSNNVYPAVALIFPFVEILTSRMAILAEADRTFGKSAAARRPIEDGISLIRNAATQIETAIRGQNKIKTSRKFTRSGRGPFPSPIGEIIASQNVARSGGEIIASRVTISYTNLSGTVSFYRDLGYFYWEDESYPENEIEAVQQAEAEAEIGLARGVTEDLTAAQLPMLRDSADSIEQSLRTSELEGLLRIFAVPAGPIARARYMMLRRGWSLKDSAQVLFRDIAAAGPDALRGIDMARLGESIIGRPITAAEANSLSTVAQMVDVASVMQLLMSHPDSVIGD